MTMSKDQYAEVYAAIVRRAVLESSADHPGDLAYAASFAVEHAGETIDILQKAGLL